MPDIIDIPDTDAWGGYQRAAEWLAAHTGRGMTRQRVWSLWKWRAGRGNGPGNGFPDRRLVRLPDGRVKEWFSKEEVLRWAGKRSGNETA